MSRYNEVKEIYDKILGTITSNKQEWKEYLDFTSRVYKYNFDNAVLIYAQRPDATMVAKMEIWNKKIGRYVNKGTRSIAVFDSSKPNLTLEYLFDIKDTNGEPHTIPKLWSLNDDVVPELMSNLNRKYNFQCDELDSLISVITEIKVYEDIENIFTDFNQDIENTWLKDMPEDGVMCQFTQTIIESTKYVVLKRCGLNDGMLIDENSFNVINHFNTSQLTFRLGNAVCSISEEILREIENEVSPIYQAL